MNKQEFKRACGFGKDQELIEEGKRQERERIIKIIDEFWLEADGILGNSFRKELKEKIK
jgi:hypothetical protein